MAVGAESWGLPCLNSATRRVHARLVDPEQKEGRQGAAEKV
jgi:hypothetical protein